VFPVAERERRRRREIACAIPNPTLRELALRSLDRKRGNLEGAAACELIAGRSSSRALVRALHSCQALCDYLDLLAEQPVGDPVANGWQLHRALLDALAPGIEPGDDYYAHHSHRDDGGYLSGLVADVRAGLAGLPALAQIEQPLRRSAERVVAYQSFNHGDALGSYAGFERWASTLAGEDELSWWELGGGAGSTMTVYALMAAASDRRLGSEAASAIESAYFPWIGALHSLLDSLADEDEDALEGERGLVGCYASSEQAAERICAIASEALTRACALPYGCRHLLLVHAMMGFYLHDVRRLETARADLLLAPLLREGGGLTRISMLMIGTYRALSAGRLRLAFPRRSAAPRRLGGRTASGRGGWEGRTAAWWPMGRLADAPARSVVRMSRLPSRQHAHAAHPPERSCADSAVRLRR
jgi:tetraprenyl-beta-curcumene synthase